MYDPHADDNEARSAELAADVLARAGLPAAFATEVRRLILATTHAALPSPADDAAFVADADLSILGAARPTFEEYERGIRQEYAFVPDAEFAQGRRAILLGLLSRSSVYASDFFRRRLEAAARANLARSIERLSAQAG